MSDTSDIFYLPNTIIPTLSSTAILDGFTITGGNANSAVSPHGSGGGILVTYCSPNLNNLTIIYNSANGGAGITMTGSETLAGDNNTKLTNSVIKNNLCAGSGAGVNIANGGPDLEVINCVISGNKTTLNPGSFNQGGAGIRIYHRGKITNCLITDNHAPTCNAGGGGIFIDWGTFWGAQSIILTGCTFSNNYALNGGGTNYTQVGGLFRNCILWGNADQNGESNFIGSSFVNCNTTPLATGAGNISSDPLFVNSVSGDFRIYGTSPCADAGNNTYNNQLYDIRGNGFDRMLNKLDGLAGTTDMGAYEYKFGVDPPDNCVNPLTGGNIDSDQQICYGSMPVGLTNLILPEGFTGSLEYKWQQSTISNLSGFTDILGANSLDYQPTEAYVTTWYKRLARVSCETDWSGAAESNVIEIEVSPLPDDLINRNGLVAYYPFHNSADDNSGNNLNGNVMGAVLVPDRNLEQNGAYYFDGIDDYILVEDPVPAELQIQNEITLSAWIYLTEYPGSTHLWLIAGSQCDACGASGASIFIDGRTNSDGQTSPPGHVHFQIGNGTWHVTNSNSVVPLNQWVHIVATRKANENGKIYYNGVEQPITSAAWDGSVSYSGAFFAIGRQRDYGDRYFKGKIDEVAVYNRAISQAEVESIYQSPLWTSETLVCENSSSEVFLINSQQDVSYQLLRNGIAWDEPQTGTGDTLTFSTGPINLDTEFTIEATNIFSNCSVLLDYSTSISVYPAYSFSESHSICQGETYTWQGTDYTEANTYTANYLSVNGCDSIYTLNLTVNPVYSFPESHSICQGETYTWQGTDYTEANTYTASYLSVNGCDSIYTLNLNVNPVYAFTEDYSICEGETYTWQGSDYTEANIYTANYLSVNGCDSIYTLNLTVNPVYAFTEDYSICEGETYTWQGTDYTEANTYTASYLSVNGCDSIYTLNLTVNTLPIVSISGLEAQYCDNIPAVQMTGDPEGGVFSGTGVSGTEFNPTIAGPGSWEIVYTYSDLNECENTASQMVIVDDCSGIENEIPSSIQVYPNPNSGDFTISLNESGDYNLAIYNSLGQIVWSQNTNMSEQKEFSVSGLVPGTYNLKFVSEAKTDVLKIVIR